MPLLTVTDLTTHFHTRAGVMKAVDGVSFFVDQGEILAIVGESGSGKSVACYSLLNLIPQPPGKIESGTALFEGRDLLSMQPDTLRRIRGSEIGIIFQDPMTSLNPYLTVGEQLIEPLLYHRNLNRQQALKRAVTMLDEVGIAEPETRIHSYPHEFSGGMRQRVMIAMAMIAEPKLLICDEPTTALDVTIQAQILSLIKALQKQRNIAVIFISHDLAVVAGLADRVAVMKEGRIVETGPVNDIFQKPRSDYTRTLLASIPAGSKPHPSQPSDQPLLLVDRLTTCFADNSAGWLSRQKADKKAVNEVSLTIQRGEILGLVGESGSGKSTLGRSILQLVPVTSGTVIFDGTDLVGLRQKRMTPLRRRMQMIFQDPYASLNPRMTVFDCLAEPLLYHGLATRKTVTAQVLALMDDVGLARAAIRKYPHEFSGGQRQRIAIGRAIATKPELIIADEPVSALDVTIQAQILALILALVEKHNLTMLFISHDLSVVRYIADRIAVMHHGELVEIAETETLFANPGHDYSRKLLSAIPALSTNPTLPTSHPAELV
ncbi:ABC transporter ATP-binding protein [uncultured Porticoccus sp.]|uniref:ABC transporter ATP-binding protein n=1 Tax=uncultured Porticoccus sp. TaxID=1256050 RepID=UPI00261C4E1A|nr:ABC transporter ATP-binding protein [uncultured Porticoccus sp.]